MLTVCCSGCRGGCLPGGSTQGGCLLGDVSAWGMCLPEEVYAWGLCLPDTPSPREQNDWQTGVKYYLVATMLRTVTREIRFTGYDVKETLAEILPSVFLHEEVYWQSNLIFVADNRILSRNTPLPVLQITGGYFLFQWMFLLHSFNGTYRFF